MYIRFNSFDAKSRRVFSLSEFKEKIENGKIILYTLMFSPLRTPNWMNERPPWKAMSARSWKRLFGDIFIHCGRVKQTNSRRKRRRKKSTKIKKKVEYLNFVHIIQIDSSKLQLTTNCTHVFSFSQWWIKMFWKSAIATLNTPNKIICIINQDNKLTIWKVNREQYVSTDGILYAFL